MDRALVIKYLRFLRERAEDLLQTETLEGYDIALLQRELADFRRNSQTATLDMPAVAESIRALQLHVSDSDVGSEKASPLRIVAQVLSARIGVLRRVENKRQEQAKGRIKNFRDEVSHLLFAIET